MNTLPAVNPFKPFLRLAAALGRFWPKPAQEAPVERPPRSRPSAQRTRVMWSGDQIHPYPFTISEPDRDERWRR